MAIPNLLFWRLFLSCHFLYLWWYSGDCFHPIGGNLQMETWFLGDLIRPPTGIQFGGSHLRFRNNGCGVRGAGSGDKYPISPSSRQHAPEP
ncbi:MAG TPA: hypothetical protein PLA50_04395, partial [Bacteroidia bacterium]|nr:hypothetical protein [Bacteroidia bacterium]